MFSIIIPTLNEEKFLPKLLDSLVAQTDKNFEVIVVDGKSKDKTVEVARAYAKKIQKLKIVVSSKASLPSQRNIGAQHASGQWLAFIDADAVMLPNFIERIALHIDQKKPELVTTWFQPDSDVVDDAIMTLVANIVLEGSLFFHRPITPGPLTIIRKDIFVSIHGYNEDHRFNEDIDLGLRLFESGVTLAILRETLYAWSMRRIRREGKMKYLQQYITAALPILLFKRPLKYMPGYVMGGHLYTKKKKTITSQAWKRYEQNLKKLFRELFE